MPSSPASRSRLNTGTLVMPKMASPPVTGSGSASRVRGSSGTAPCRPIRISVPTTCSARGERGGHVAVAEGEVGGHVAAREQPGRTGLGGRGRVQHRGRLVDVHVHQFGRVLGQVRVLGHDHGQRLADVADRPGGQHRLEVAAQVDALHVEPDRDLQAGRADRPR